MAEEQQLTAEQQEEQRVQWIRHHYQKANEYLAKKGVIPKQVAVEECRYLVPYLGLWKITATDKSKYWVLSGDLPTDHISATHAKTAREALQNFSLRWQLKAETVFNSGTKDETQIKYANLLVHRAENMYSLYSDDVLWGETA